MRGIRKSRAIVYDVEDGTQSTRKASRKVQSPPVWQELVTLSLIRKDQFVSLIASVFPAAARTLGADERCKAASTADWSC